MASFDLDDLTAVLEAVDRGIDRLTTELTAQVSAVYTGRSRPGNVAASVTGGGDVVDVTYRFAGERTVADIVARSPLGRFVEHIHEG